MVLLRFVDHRLRHGYGQHDDTIVVGDDDIARDDGDTAAGNGNVDGVGIDAGLDMVVRCPAAQPQGNIEFFDIGPVAHAAVNDNARAAPALEIGRHHVAEHARTHIAARIHHHDVPFLNMVEDVPVQLRLWIGIFALAEQVRPLWHELQSQRRADDGFAVVLRHRTDHVRIAETHVAKRAGDSRSADLAERVDHLFGRPGDIGRVCHVKPLLKVATS